MREFLRFKTFFRYAGKGDFVGVADHAGKTARRKGGKYVFSAFFNGKRLYIQRRRKASIDKISADSEQILQTDPSDPRSGVTAGSKGFYNVFPVSRRFEQRVFQPFRTIERSGKHVAGRFQKGYFFGGKKRALIEISPRKIGCRKFGHARFRTRHTAVFYRCADRRGGRNASRQFFFFLCADPFDRQKRYVAFFRQKSAGVFQGEHVVR